MAATTAIQCHHSPNTIVRITETKRAETPVLGLFKDKLLTSETKDLALILAAMS
jgi:hypothetical protein